MLPVQLGEKPSGVLHSAVAGRPVRLARDASAADTNHFDDPGHVERGQLGVEVRGARPEGVDVHHELI